MDPALRWKVILQIHGNSPPDVHYSGTFTGCSLKEAQFTLDAYNSRMKPLERAATLDSFLTSHQFYF